MTPARVAAKETKRIQTECLYFQLDRHKTTIIKIFPVFKIIRRILSFALMLWTREIYRKKKTPKDCSEHFCARNCLRFNRRLVGRDNILSALLHAQVFLKSYHRRKAYFKGAEKTIQRQKCVGEHGLLWLIAMILLSSCNLLLPLSEESNQNVYTSN